MVSMDLRDDLKDFVIFCVSINRLVYIASECLFEIIDKVGMILFAAKKEFLILSCLSFNSFGFLSRISRQLQHSYEQLVVFWISIHTLHC